MDRSPPRLATVRAFEYDEDDRRKVIDLAARHLHPRNVSIIFMLTLFWQTFIIWKKNIWFSHWISCSRQNLVPRFYLRIRYRFLAGIRNFALLLRQFKNLWVIVWSEHLRHLYEDEIVALVEHTGLVTLVRFELYAFKCVLDVDQFPFDSQTCRITFSPWVHDVDAWVGFW